MENKKTKSKIDYRRLREGLAYLFIGIILLSLLPGVGSKKDLFLIKAKDKDGSVYLKTMEINPNTLKNKTMDLSSLIKEEGHRVFWVQNISKKGTKFYPPSN